MKKTLPLLLLAATTALAGGREPFPSDYTPHPCAPAGTCRTVPRSQFVQASAITTGANLEMEWLDKNWDLMVELTRPVCAKLGTCLATEGNLAIFCNDLLRGEYRVACDRFPKSSEDYGQCILFMRTFSLGADLRDKEAWQAGQACAKEKTPITGQRTMEAWIDADFEAYKGTFRAYAIDSETHVPVMAVVSIPDVTLRADAPGGQPLTSYAIKWKPSLVRVPNTDGHSDLVAPRVTLTAANHAPVTLDIPIAPGKVIVEMVPPASQLKRGRNTFTVTARDAATSKPVELRVLAGETILGDTNEPLELTLGKGEKRPEIWATSLFDRYSDVVIAPAGQ